MNIRKKRKMSSIPLSSMGDIAFLLLVFYMATTMVTDQKPREVDLPEVEASVKSSPYPLIIYMNTKMAASDQVFFYNKMVPVDQLSDHLLEKAASAPAAVRVYLNIEKNIPFQKMNNVLESVKSAGIRSLIITTKPAGAGSISGQATPDDA